MPFCYSMSEAKAQGGAAGDGTTDDRAAIDSLATEIGDNGTLLFSPGAYRIGSNLTLSCAIAFEPGAMLVPDNGVVVSVNGALDAPISQIFDMSNGGIVEGAPLCDNIHPEWFYSGNTDWTPAFFAAFRLCGAPNTGPSTATNGRRISLQQRQYDCATVWGAIDSYASIEVVGQGSTFIYSFKAAPSTIMYTGNDAGPFIKFDNNFARGWVFRDLAIQYNDDSFTGDLIEVAAPGLHCINCYIAGFGFRDIPEPSPDAIYSARSLIYISENVESVKFDSCVFQKAERAVLVADDASITGPVSFTDCWFYDVTTQWVEFLGIITATFQWTRCGFDPIYRQPTSGVVVKCHGFAFVDCGFRGLATMAPTGAFLTVEGTGRISGGIVSTNYTGIHAKNVVLALMGGTIVHAAQCLLVEEGSTSVKQGGPNAYYRQNSGTTAVSIVPNYSGSGIAQIELGPDLIGPESGGGQFTYSYFVGTPSSGTASYENIHGVIHYDSATDTSTSGPVFSCLVRAEAMTPTTANFASGATLQQRQTGTTITNSGAIGAVTFNLPAAAVACSFRIQKRANQNITIARAGSDVILKLGTAGITSMANTSLGETYAEIWLEGFYDPAIGQNMWRVSRTYGTWT